MANRFRILLNWISARLNEQEIRSLMLMCEVPESQQARMQDGISLFDNLIKRDIINEHKLDKLKMMLKHLCPKRRDLIREIEKFENGTKTQDDASSTLTSIGSMPSTVRSISRSDEKETWFTVECPCMKMSCYKYGVKIAWSYVVLSVFFLMCFLTVVLFWYANVPKVSDAIASDKHVEEAGPFILIAIAVLFLAFLFSTCYMRKRRDCRQYAATGNQNGMQEVQTRNFAMRVTSAGISNLGKIDDEDIADSRAEGTDTVSGTEDPDADSGTEDPDNKLQCCYYIHSWVHMKRLHWLV